MENRDTQIAVWAESLYLFNLLLAPGLGFLILFWLYQKHKDSTDPVNRSHLRQTLMISLIGGLLIAVVIGLTIVLGGTSSANIWLFVLLYFTLVHSSLILMGILGLVKALNGQDYIYPVFGRWLTPGNE